MSGRRRFLAQDALGIGEIRRFGSSRVTRKVFGSFQTYTQRIAVLLPVLQVMRVFAAAGDLFDKVCPESPRRLSTARAEFPAGND